VGNSLAPYYGGLMRGIHNYGGLMRGIHLWIGRVRGISVSFTDIKGEWNKFTELYRRGTVTFALSVLFLGRTRVESVSCGVTD